jgi:hypothetical protein
MNYDKAYEAKKQRLLRLYWTSSFTGIQIQLTLPLS